MALSDDDLKATLANARYAAGCTPEGEISRDSVEGGKGFEVDYVESEQDMEDHQHRCEIPVDSEQLG